MRVLIFSQVFPPAIGGPSTQALNLCRALVQKGAIPTVITYGGQGHILDLKYGFKVYRFKTVYTGTFLDKAIRWIVFPFYIGRMLIKEKADILHCNSASALSFVAAFVAMMMGVPRVLKFAGDWVWETLSTYKLTKAKDFKEIYTSSLVARFMTMVERVGVGLFNVIWTPSKFRRQNIIDLMGSAEKTVIIPNCLLLSGGSANTYNVGEKVIVISANRFIPHKRVSLIVESFVKMNIPNSELVLIGGGSKEETVKVENTIKDLKVEDRVTLAGILSSEEVYEHFSKASFYVSASIEEGFPNVFIEAMNYGLPIIAMDNGGSKELVVHDKTGFMLEPEDTEGLVEKMKLLATDTALATRMSQAAFERSKEFNLEYRIEEFLSMYKKLLNK